MSELPPRRSRPPAPRDPGPALPLIPILIGVIVLGFVIGAGLSIAGKRGAAQRTVVANASPAAQPSLPPVTPAPSEKPTPATTDVPVRPTLAPAQTPPSRIVPTAAQASPTRAPATRAPATKAPASSENSAPPSEAPTALPRSPQHTVLSLPKATTKPAVRPPGTAPIDAPTPVDDVDSEFGRLASAVVREYLGAIARGDTATATAAFGPNATNVQLTESGIVGAGARIEHVEARGVGDNETVNVDLKTPNGLYFGQYTVHRNPSGAALITDHTINKL